jgi:hypothetical protein
MVAGDEPFEALVDVEGAEEADATPVPIVDEMGDALALKFNSLYFRFLNLQCSKCNRLLNSLKFMNDLLQYMQCEPNSMFNLKFSSFTFELELWREPEPVASLPMFDSIVLRILQFSTCIFLLNSFKLANGLAQNKHDSPMVIMDVGVLVID